MFTGAVAPDFSNQVRDFNPGIANNGLFWTIAVPPDSGSINLDKGTARFKMDNLELLDFFNISNSLTDGAATGPPVAATVSFDIRWTTPSDHYRIRDFDQGFRGEFWETDGTITWSGSNDDGDSFESSSVTEVVSAAIGRERNGKFA